MSDIEPNTENIVYMDEYPELKKRAWLRRIERERKVGVTALTKIVEFPGNYEPDEPA